MVIRSSLQVDVRWDDAGGVTLAPTGELDLATGPVLVGRAREVIAGHPSGLVLDLAGLRFMDCAGLAAVKRVARELRALSPGCPLVLHSPAPAVRKLLETTGTDYVPDIMHVA
jgi:anti-anti-sigma factor